MSRTIVARDNSRAIAIGKAVAITISFALVYWFICTLTPELSKSSLMGVMFGKTLKLANLLKGFIVVTPYAAVGTALGAHAFNVQSGDVAWTYPILPSILAALGLFWYGVSRRIGRSTVNDILVLVGYGVMHNAIVSANRIGFALIMERAGFGEWMLNVLAWKMLTGTGIIVAGYLLVKAFEAATRKD